MHISVLKLQDFRNYIQLSLRLHEQLNGFAGANGAGKTNLLEAIYQLLTARSMLSLSDRQLIRRGAEGFSIEGSLLAEGAMLQIRTAYFPAQGKRLIQLNQSVVARLQDFYGRFPLVSITPTDADLIREAAEVRRRIMDAFFAQINTNYLHYLIRYHALLKQRNALLKQLREQQHVERSLVEVYNYQLHEQGHAIHQLRQSLTEALTPILQQYYQHISQGKETVGFVYHSSLHQEPLSDQLARSLEVDLRLGFTTRGIHRDDWQWLLNHEPFRANASQGQQKTLLIALKLAMGQLLFSYKQQKPFLLLDDIFDKLDSMRVGALLELVGSQIFGQTFMTHTSSAHMQQLLKNHRLSAALYLIDNGKIQ